MLADDAQADLGALYALLSRIFLEEADAALVRALAAADLDVFKMSLAWGEAELENEAVEYARLFLLPGGVCPYAAAWVDGEPGAVRADLQERIADLYDALRLRPIEFGHGNIPSDHVGMLLALTAAALGTAPSGDLVRRSLALLDGWAPAFAAEVVARSTSPLYRASAHLLVGLLEATKA